MSGTESGEGHSASSFHLMEGSSFSGSKLSPFYLIFDILSIPFWLCWVFVAM